MQTQFTDSTAVGKSEQPQVRPHMNAARIVAPRQLEIATVPLPVPGPGQVRIRVEGCGLCSSNLAVWQGRPWFKYPLDVGAPGHEAWGRINALGAEVKNFKIGERVGFLSDQSFAEFALSEAVTLVRAPERSEVFPAEALGCAVNIFRRAHIHRNQTVTVIGSGFIGALLIALAVQHSARVLALSRRPYARLIARCAGANAAFAVDAAAIDRIMDLTSGAGCDQVIEAAGTQETLTIASRLVKVRGRLIIAGYHQDGPREVNMQLWNWRGIDVINAHERNPNAYVSGMGAAADLIDHGTLDPSFLYTHRFSLARLGEALDTLEERPEGFLKGWIAF